MRHISSYSAAIRSAGVWGLGEPTPRNGLVVFANDMFQGLGMVSLWEIYDTSLEEGNVYPERGLNSDKGVVSNSNKGCT